MGRTDQDAFVIYLHIPKAAGTTIDRLLRRHYGPGLPRRILRRLLPREKGLSIREGLERVSPRDRYAAGHFCYGVHEFLPKPSRYFTLVREPVGRLVSLYHYSAHTPFAYYHRQAAGRTAEQFLLETPLMELDNGQLRFLVGGSEDLFLNRTPIGGCTRAMLDQARENIEKSFAVVGLVERFDETLLLLRRALGWGSCHYFRQNESPVKGGAVAVGEETRRILAERNALDIELYEWIRGRFEREVLALGPGFQEELLRFRERNRAYGNVMRPLYRPYAWLKAALPS